jgi:hypothetical protein
MTKVLRAPPEYKSTKITITREREGAPQCSSRPCRQQREINPAIKEERGKGYRQDEKINRNTLRFKAFNAIYQAEARRRSLPAKPKVAELADSPSRQPTPTEQKRGTLHKKRPSSTSQKFRLSHRFILALEPCESAAI